ncbi:cytochrome b5 [Dentipellis sp. KUC8613]|nr:cytochrome b5 [Dentipellis sp. KUC8613]
MSSYLRSWFSTPASSLPLASDSNSIPPPDALISVSPPHSDDDDGFTAKDEEEDADTDAPPAFPAPNSAQRLQAPSTSSLGVPQILTDAALMPPPPNPSLNRRGAGGLGVPSSSLGASLQPPPTTLLPPKKSARREKVALTPGHSPLDWANLKSSGTDLRGGAEQLMRIPPSVLKMHNKRDDAWSAFNGKVYNITPYLAFHPGGERELMRVAGRDGTKLFALTHAWVNVDFMLDACLVGFLVSEPH